MSIGYACITVGIPYTGLKTCRLKNADEETLHTLIQHNLNSLNNIIDYNINNNIKLFRICSELIPFGSAEVNKVEWQAAYQPLLNTVANKIKNNGIRVSMHPGQYTILNSPRKDVIYNAIKDLEYHCKVLDSLQTDRSNKIVLHIGGVYGDKKAAINEFKRNYRTLDDSIKNRIVIENDDKFYNITDVLNISEQLNIPVIYDTLHHKINPAGDEKDENFYLEKCKKTFAEKDGKQKIHYSEQHSDQRAGSHSDTLNCKNFVNFYNNLNDKDIDIMLEVKDKNLSAIKCINAINNENNIAALEKEWKRYKYKIMECSPDIYQQVSVLLNVHNEYPAISFYDKIDHALKENVNTENGAITALTVFDYIKNRIADEQKEIFYNKLHLYKSNRISVKPIKNFLWEHVEYYNIDFLQQSYYFHL